MNDKASYWLVCYTESPGFDGGGGAIHGVSHEPPRYIQSPEIFGKRGQLIRAGRIADGSLTPSALPQKKEGAAPARRAANPGNDSHAFQTARLGDSEPAASRGNHPKPTDPQ